MANLIRSWKMLLSLRSFELGKRGNRIPQAYFWVGASLNDSATHLCSQTVSLELEIGENCGGRDEDQRQPVQQAQPPLVQQRRLAGDAIAARIDGHRKVFGAA